MDLRSWLKSRASNNIPSGLRRHTARQSPSPCYAERHVRIYDQVLVDPNGPGLHPMSDRVQFGRVAAPNRSPKPVVCGIGDLDRLVDGAVLDQRPQRTEVFELHVVGVGGRVVEDRDWKEVAFPFDLIA